MIGPAYTVKYIKKDVRYVSSQGLIALPLEYHQRHYVSCNHSSGFIADAQIKITGSCVAGDIWRLTFFFGNPALLHLLIQPIHNREQIDSVPSGSVLFISAPSDIVNAVYGGLMSTRAKYCRAAGTIVDGRIRDLQEHRDLGYAVSTHQLLYSVQAKEN